MLLAQVKSFCLVCNDLKTRAHARREHLFLAVIMDAVSPEGAAGALRGREQTGG